MEVMRRLSDPAGWNEQHGEYLLRYALQHVRDRHLAQDLVQETWLAANGCSTKHRIMALTRLRVTRVPHGGQGRSRGSTRLDGLRNSSS